MAEIEETGYTFYKEKTLKHFEELTQATVRYGNGLLKSNRNGLKTVMA
jgi:hypothetical protein